MANNMTDKQEYSGLEIAVIGMSGRFPGAKNVDEFWMNLKNGKESITFFTNEELEEVGIERSLLENYSYIKAKGVLEEAEYFDAAFFGYTPREAEMMDPQIRIFHELVYTALEDAGYNSNEYSGTIGLFGGAAYNHAWSNLPLSPEEEEVQFASSVLAIKDYLTTLISHKLNLTGPSYSIDTACSTGLVAVDIACKSLLAGSCDMAIAGAISISLPQKSGYLYQEGMILSPDGHCRSFDISAGGTIPGDGGGVVVLKRLEDALIDGDCIHAIIKGSATNNDGLRKVDYTAPSVEGQIDVIKTAHYMAEVDPTTISYVEAHGTGTPLGDPIEIESLNMAFGQEKKHYCKLGAVKTNIGHLNTASGIAGLIKTILALKHKMIPPTLHFNESNPKIDFVNSPFVVNTELSEWVGPYPLRAGVSSFGIGGTNAHVVLEEAKPMISKELTRKQHLIMLSAATSIALEKQTKELGVFLQKNPDISLADVAYTLQVGRRPLKYRRFGVFDSVEKAAKSLLDKNSLFNTMKANYQDQFVVFMFSGQGSQYVNMGRDLYENNEIFRKEADWCFEWLQTYIGIDYKEVLYPQSGNNTDEKIRQTQFAQVLIFVVEYALAKTLITWGIKPRVVIGHSIGEFVAACISGVMKLEEALSIVVRRGQLMQKLPKGAMLSVALSEKEVLPLLKEGLEIAAVNGPKLCVVAGEIEAIEQLEEELMALNFQFSRLHTSHAFHSKMVEPILDEFEQVIDGIQLRPPQISYLSNLTGKYVSKEEVTSKEYWVRHLRETVRFNDGIEELLLMKHAMLIEVGAGNTLATLIKRHPAKKDGHTIVNTLRQVQEIENDIHYLFHKLGIIWGSGIQLDWEKFSDNVMVQRISLPTYPYQRDYFWKYPNRLLNQKGLKGVGKAIKNSNDTVSRLSQEKWLYTQSWNYSPLNNVSSSIKLNTLNWLIFQNGDNFTGQLVKKLIEQGQQVFTLEIGTGFAKLSERRYVINPANRKDFDLLFKELQMHNFTPHRIINSWGLEFQQENELEPSYVASMQQRGFYTLLFLAQACQKQKISNNTRIITLTSQVQDIAGEVMISPIKCTILGLIKVIPQEFPLISCQTIDITLPVQGGRQEIKLIDKLIEELMLKRIDPVVAYRGQQRFVENYVPLEVSSTNSNLIKDGGVYLITGGLGGIGLTIAKTLSETANVKLVLMGRSPIPSFNNWKSWSNNDEVHTTQIISKLKEIENNGSEVLLLQGDVADQQRMEWIINQVNQHFGQLNGVIHAAGITSGSSINSISELDVETCEEQFKPKVHGLISLQKVLQGHSLDFCILISSLSSILGGIGYGAYASANAFLDGFAKWQNQVSGTRWISIAWDGWSVGQTNTDNQLLNKFNQFLITESEGEKIFKKVIDKEEAHQVVISTTDLQHRLSQWVYMQAEVTDLEDSNEEQIVYPRPEMDVSYTAPTDQIEKVICNILEEFLGVEKVGIYDNFFDLGLSSLDIVSIVKKLKGVIAEDISVVSMFTYPTVSLLTEFLTQQQQIPFSNDENEWIEGRNEDRKNIRRKRLLKEVKLNE